jgi:hypothetical protein
MEDRKENVGIDKKRRLFVGPGQKREKVSPVQFRSRKGRGFDGLPKSLFVYV